MFPDGVVLGASGRFGPLAFSRMILRRNRCRKLRLKLRAKSQGFYSQMLPSHVVRRKGQRG